MTSVLDDVGGQARVDPRILRDICANFLTGVTVVTSLDAGEPIGVTVNSFASVSLEPPLVLFCAHRDSRVRKALHESGSFAVNILSAAQKEVGWRFARNHSVGFGDLSPRVGRSGAPILAGTLAYLECCLAQEIEAGDHTIVLGSVVDHGQLAQERPLAFFRSSFVDLADAA